MPSPVTSGRKSGGKRRCGEEADRRHGGGSGAACATATTAVPFSAASIESITPSGSPWNPPVRQPGRRHPPNLETRSIT